MMVLGISIELQPDEAHDYGLSQNVWSLIIQDTYNFFQCNQ